MTAFKLTQFDGLRPRVPESLLPEGAATIAQNCDFGYGELRGTKDGFLFLNTTNAPLGIYTDDGTSFYTWPVDVDAVRSPIVNDLFTRMYYTGTAGGMRVADRTGTRSNGGEPSGSYLVGVPRPTIAPTLTAGAVPTVDATTATLTFTFHYEYGGVKYQEAAVTPTALGAGAYRFTPPAIAVGTPATAFVVLRMKAVAIAPATQSLDLYSSNSSLPSSDGYYSLAILKDASGSTYTATLSGKLEEDDKEARAYVYTYVNIYGEEGPPSPAAAVTSGIGLPVGVGVTKDAIGSYAPIKEIRVYRTPTGSTIASYFYAGTVPALTGSTFNFNDTVPAALLNEEISSLNYYPPKASLIGLMSLPNGILCAWSGNELHFCEAYKPWAWPPAYVKTLKHSIVGGIKHGAGALITTRGAPYVVSGVSSDSMTESGINIEQAGLSKWSLAVVDGVVLYASNDGIVVVSGNEGRLTESEGYFTREVWRERYRTGFSTMRFSVWDGRLVVFSSAGSFTPFMLRTDEAKGAMTDLPSFAATCAFISPLSDQFYYTIGSGIYQFQGGSAQTLTWQSRELVIANPVNYGAAQTLVEGSWTVTFYAFNNQSGAYEQKHAESLSTGRKSFRLPSGYESDRYRIKIVGSGRFRELRVGQTMKDLAKL